VRLTLRTLLSYLDDTLDPTQTRLIGQKVAESPAAQELITRIKEVVRRRRLSTPPSTGPDAKLDANVVAEYIDNILSPEMIAQVEEVCLESDVYLAEIAACHQLLTVILSEPALVPPTAKRRMYSLIKGREAIPHRRAPAPAAAERSPAPVAHAGDDHEETLLLGLSSLAKHDSWVRRFAPLGGAVLLVIGVVVAIWYALPPAPSQTEPDFRIPELARAGDGNKTPEAKIGPETKPEVKPESKPEQEPKPEVKPEPKPEVKPEPKPEQEPKPEVKPEPKPEPRPAGPREIGTYVAVPANGPSILLRRTDQKSWQ
jgi:hypothetical protein